MLIISRLQFVTLSFLLILFHSLNAHSTDETLGALKYFELITEHQIERYRTRDNEEVLRLRFKSHGRHFHIHLQPTSRINRLPIPKILINNQPIDSNRLLNIQAYHGDLYNEQDSDYIAEQLELQHRPNGILPQGWARLTFDGSKQSAQLNDLDGTLFDGQEMFTIVSVRQYRRYRRPIDIMVNEEINDDRLLIYRNADRRKLHKRSLVGGFNHSQHEQTFCGTEYSPGSDLPRFRFEPPLRETGFSNQVDSSITANVNLLRRASGFPQGCPQDMKVLYMGVAADCEYTDTYGGSDGALRQIITDWNQASQVFQKSFNIMLAIHTINLLTECDSAVGSLPWNQKCSSSYSISQRLSDFSKWRGQPAQKDPNGLWVLMTKCSSGTTIGISWLNMVCVDTFFAQQSANGGTLYVSGTSVVSAGPSEWIVVAHEIGHSFGANHDCTAGMCMACPGPNCQCCSCQANGCDCEGMYIMNPTSDVRTDTFSPCSVNTICRKISTLGSCLKAPGSLTTISGNTCGNGIKEYGEDCDCGAANGTACIRNPCCDGSICRYRMNAVCDDSTDTCCQDCRFKSSGFVCRPAVGSCDIQETCTGDSAVCPSDNYIEDTSTCLIGNSTNGQCASGQCTSRDKQCQMRGTGSDIVGSCPDFNDQCAMYCSTISGRCMQVNGYFIDGTACGYGGKCVNGGCVTSTLGTIIGWMQRNRTLTIILGIALGLILLSCLWEFARYIFCPSRKKSSQVEQPIGRAQAIRRANSPYAQQQQQLQRPITTIRPQSAVAPNQQPEPEPVQRLILHLNAR